MEPPQKIEVQTSSFCSILFGINRLMSTGRRPTLHESEQHIEAVDFGKETEANAAAGAQTDAVSILGKAAAK